MDIKKLQTLSALFRERISLTPTKIAYRFFNNNTWQNLTWQEFANQVAKYQAVFIQNNLQAGDKVAIMMKNRYEWLVFDQAALGLNLVTVPLYVDDNIDNIAYILEHAEVKLLLIEGNKQWRTLKEKLLNLDKIKLLRLDEQEQWLLNLESIEIESLHFATTNKNQLASIIYTSGTTGRPKGVMLSHYNLLYNAYAASQCADFNDKDVFLSFLPLSHAFERTAGYYLPMLVGATVVHARSIQQLASDLKEIKPTVFPSVPRIYEQFYAKIQKNLSEQSKIKRKLFNLAINIGWQRFQGNHSLLNRFLSAILTPLVCKPILDRFGGRLRIVISGGAALSPEISKMFISLGMPLYQAYGLTETSPLISVNRRQNNIPKSVGKVAPGIEVKLGDNDELLTKSPSLMLGYWKNKVATNEVIDNDNSHTDRWFHTGDVAKIDNEGYIYITGRIKDIIVMSNGENVPPTDMEMAIVNNDEMIEQIVVIGEGKAFLSAIIVMNKNLWHENDFDNDKNQKKLQKYIAKYTKEFPAYAQLRKFIISFDLWTVENGLLTPTLKVKRAKVIKYHEDKIEQLYKL
jgi:long-chain acyl-CoA synthetase